MADAIRGDDHLGVEEVVLGAGVGVAVVFREP
jgi:hypothetical protein